MAVAVVLAETSNNYRTACKRTVACRLLAGSIVGKKAGKEDEP